MSRPSIDEALDAVLASWGHVDVLVNNAIYQGPGLMYRFTEFTQEQLDAALLGTLVNQVHLTRRLLPDDRSGGRYGRLHRFRRRGGPTTGVSGKRRLGLPVWREQSAFIAWRSSCISNTGTTASARSWSSPR